MTNDEIKELIEKNRTTPINKEAHEILVRYGWKFLMTDDESGYDYPGRELTLVVARSGAWRVYEPTSYREHILADGLIEDLEAWLKEEWQK